MSDQKRIFVSGGGGFVAPHLLAALPAEWDVTLHVRSLDRAAHLPERPGRRIVSGPLHQAMLRDEFARNVDTVIHLAGAVHGTSVEQIIDDNLVTTANVVSAMASEGVSRIVFMSTASVWSDLSGQTLDETIAPNPSTVYGHVKLAAERLIREAVVQGAITCGIALRCNNTYGPGGMQGAVAAFATRIRADQNVTIYGDGQQLREPLYVSDLVDVLIRAAKLTSGMNVYGISGPRALTILEMAEIVARTLGRPLAIEWLEEHRERVRHIVIDTSKARQEMGWAPKVAFEDGVKALV